MKKLVSVTPSLTYLNPLPSSDAVRGNRKKNQEDLFSSVLAQFNGYHSSGNLKFNNTWAFSKLTIA